MADITDTSYETVTVGLVFRDGGQVQFSNGTPIMNLPNGFSPAVVGLTTPQPAPANLTGNAGATYTTAEQGMINALNAQVNALLAALKTAGVIQ